MTAVAGSSAWCYGTDDRVAAGPPHHHAGRLARFGAHAWTRSGYVPTDSERHGSEDSSAMCHSDPVRYARNMAVLEEAPNSHRPRRRCLGRCGARLMKRFAMPGYAGHIRQPILLVAPPR